MPRKKSKSYTSSKAKRVLGARASVVKEGPEPFLGDRFENILADFERATIRFGEALDQPYDEFIRDSSLQRFEFTAELSWKTLRTYLTERLHNETREINSPKGVFREAFKQGLIEDEPFWLEIIDARNALSHTYKEEVADHVYAILPRALGLFQSLLKTLKEKRG